LKTLATSNTTWNEEELNYQVVSSGQFIIRSNHESGSSQLKETLLGLPLLQGTELVGLVCIADKPGGYTAIYAEQLIPLMQTLATIIQAIRTDALNKKISENLNDTTRRLELAYRASGIGIWEVNFETDTLLGDDRICDIIGVSDKKISLESLRSLYHPDDKPSKIEWDRAKRYSHDTDYYYEFRIVRPDGGIRFLRIFGILIRDERAKLTSGVMVVYDQTRYKEYEHSLLNSLQEKDMLIKEIHHRVKNNLQLISSMLYLKVLTSDNQSSRAFMTSMREKIKSVSLIHERLLQTESLNSIDIRDYLKKLLHDIEVTYHTQNLNLHIRVDVEKHYFTTDNATYLGQLVNELVINAIKHAFIDSSYGEINVSLHKIFNNKFRLIVQDNGLGLPAETSPVNPNSYGMQLIEIFVKQLKGKLELNRIQGTTFEIIF